MNVSHLFSKLKLHSHKDAERSRRRKRDIHLKEQAQASKRRKLHTEPEQSATVVSATESFLARKNVEDDDLPDDLPDDILAIESKSQRLDIPGKQTSKPNKLKRLDNELKPIKDLNIGHRKVRILQHTNMSLPPATVRQTNNIKEAWVKVRAQESKKKIAGYRVRGGGARTFFNRQRISR